MTICSHSSSFCQTMLMTSSWRHCLNCSKRFLMVSLVRLKMVNFILFIMLMCAYLTKRRCFRYCSRSNQRRSASHYQVGYWSTARGSAASTSQSSRLMSDNEESAAGIFKSIASEKWGIISISEYHESTLLASERELCWYFIKVPDIGGA